MESLEFTKSKNGDGLRIKMQEKVPPLVFTKQVLMFMEQLFRPKMV